jgi:hypothetical protein
VFTLGKRLKIVITRLSNKITTKLITKASTSTGEVGSITIGSIDPEIKPMIEEFG